MHTPATHDELRLEESQQSANRTVPRRFAPWVWLAVATVLLPFSNGADTIALAAWLAPVFMLRFVRSQPYKVGLPVAYVLLLTMFAVQFRGMVPIPGVAYYIFLVIWAVPLVVPYVIDRLIAHRLAGLMGSLVFPTAWATTEYVLSKGPYATWGSAAYSQYGNLCLLQVLSVTGLWGITFLIAWFASTCNWAWEEGPASRAARRGAWLCFGTIATVILLGGARLAFFPPSSPTVRVASISKRQTEPELSEAVSKQVFAGQVSTQDRALIRRWATARNDDLLSRAEREMQAGARIVFWGETNAPVLKADEPALVARGSDLAAKYHAYLGMALGVLREGGTPPLENKVVMIQPNGSVVWEYSKTHPVPGPEAAMQVRGDGRLRAVDTPYGRVSSIICYDGDFPQLLAQAGSLGADIVLDPSNDWRAIDPWHTQMASFRATEQGFNLVRHTSQGLSAAFDYQGRRLAAMDDYQSADYAMVSEIPVKGVRTIYSKAGDWFAGACLTVLGLLFVQSLRRKRA